MKRQLTQHSRTLRQILDSCKKEYPNLFGTFPNAYCADASLWLCDYLISKGYDSTQFLFRAKDPFSDGLGNHVWLHYMGVNLDVTADQFNSYGFNFSPVMVSDKNPYYICYDEEWLKKEYSAHSFSPLCCLCEDWGEKYDIVYKKMGIRFDIKSVSVAI